jgi:membrane protease YdiL (CAAX protease family)
MSSLPPPIPGTAVRSSPNAVRGTTPDVVPTLPLVAAVGAIGVLSGSLIVSKYLLDSIVGFGWPVAVYVALLASVGYGPSLWWCRFASRRWGTGDLGTDIGLTPRFADLGWGPVIWLGAIGAQIVVAAVIVALGVPLVGNTDAIEEISADRTYVVSLVITAVIAAPVVEEMVFRGVVMRGLRSRLPIVAVVVLQGLLFGAAHIDPVRGVGNVGLVLVLAGVGVAFGVAVVLLGRIGPAMVAHALFNGAVLLVVLTGVADRLDGASSSVGEQVGVVDQADIAEPGGDGDAHPSRPAMVDLEPIDRAQVAGVEHGDVVEVCERLVVDRTGGRLDHVGHARTV